MREYVQGLLIELEQERAKLEKIHKMYIKGIAFYYQYVDQLEYVNELQEELEQYSEDLFL